MKKKLLKEFSVVAIVYFFYFLSTLYQSDFWGNILSPINAFLAVIIITRNVFMNNRVIHKICWLLLAIAVFSWMVSDILWAVYEMFLGLDPAESSFVNDFYLLTNLFLTIGVLAFGITMFKKWNLIQLFLDSVTVGVTILVLFYIIFLDKDLTILRGRTISDLSSAVVIADIIILAFIMIWVLSVRKGYVRLWTILLALGTILFVITDLYYYYLEVHNIYEANSLIDAIYMLSFILLALAASVRIGPESDTGYLINEGYSNVGARRNGMYLLFVGPVLVIILKGVLVYDIITLIIVIAIQFSYTFYIQLAMQNEQLLKRELENSISLEKQIEERTMELMDKNKKLDLMAQQDTITILKNRRYFFQELDHLIKETGPDDNIALLYIDIERYKYYSSIYGHQTGDYIIKEAADQLYAFFGENTLIGRLGGDEYVVALEGNLQYSDVEKIAKEMTGQCSTSIMLQNFELDIRLRAGISIFPLDAVDSNTLLKNAETAMSILKTNHGKYWLSYDLNTSKIVNRKRDIEYLLNKADFDTEFELYYQPQFQIPGDQLIGMEALIRWKTKSGEDISPAEFIPIAEEMGYIKDIGKWVMKKAILQIATWNKKYHTEFVMGINVSIKQLESNSFLYDLKQEMEIQKIKPEWIDIEITESIAVNGDNRIIDLIHLIKETGVSISIDDFGTGYSSLSYLKFLPVNRLKIARELINTINNDNYDLQIVKAINGLAKSVGIKTIAEGVETEDQYEILIHLECGEIQGFLLSKPLMKSDCEKLIESYIT